MTLPFIHSNGTPAQDLLEGYYHAMVKTQEALDALRKIEFNARDYYPQGPDAWNKAREEMAERQRKLRGIYDELFVIAEEVMRQGNL